ncbi:DNA repair exonuclease MRE11 [Trachipleistophora hominis]|uniref:DNA repair exonuclease MRE11 n=1 Tax=Trachipleistophora hominis TaxID=72359 RepID=L7JTB5_TRAHO|nr:DNA repair exonuclease MRE11 [Trachipleistophora hominis]
MKILITSDNHLGYKETDPLLSLDSFNAFEEVLQGGKECDLMIIAGDLFHNNRPSRFTMYKTIQLLKKHVLGNKEIRITANKRLNYEKPNINISLPVVVINGNHDDPCGFGSLSALDVLHQTGLVNYVGKINNYERIVVEPLIVKMEQTVALYCLSHVRDSRLYKLFSQNKIEFLKSNADINILIVHQNRIERSRNDFLPSEFIPDFFNLIVFGHEHDPLLFERNEQTYLQCGSTVRTSLCEAETGKKYFYRLEVAESIKIEKIELKSVRPFLFDTLSTGTKEVVQSKLEEMLGGVSKCEKCEGEAFCDACKPLVRLRLEDDVSFNKLHLQNVYADKVANPGDIFLLIKKRKPVVIRENKPVHAKCTDIYGIVHSYLVSSNLGVIPELVFLDKFREYVEKENRGVFQSFIDELEEHRNGSIVGCEIEHFKNLKESMNRKFVRENNVHVQEYEDVALDPAVGSLNENNSSLIYDMDDPRARHRANLEFVGAEEAVKRSKVHENVRYTLSEEQINNLDLVEYARDNNLIKHDFSKKTAQRDEDEEEKNKENFTFSNFL